MLDSSALARLRVINEYVMHQLRRRGEEVSRFLPVISRLRHQRIYASFTSAAVGWRVSLARSARGHQGLFRRPACHGLLRGEVH